MIDENGEYVTRIEKKEENDMVAAIKDLGEDRAKIIVKGEYMDPVFVNVFNRNDELVVDDYIERTRSFSRIYDLSGIKTGELRIEVAAGQKLLASTSL